MNLGKDMDLARKSDDTATREELLSQLRQARGRVISLTAERDRLRSAAALGETSPGVAQLISQRNAARREVDQLVARLGAAAEAYERMKESLDECLAGEQ